MSGLFWALYRIRQIPLSIAAAVLIAVALTNAVPPMDWLERVRGIAGLVALVVFAAAVVISLIGARRLPSREAVVVHAPVVGRWKGLNSPATKVPSHGTRAYGQAYAIDLLADPEGVEAPAFGSGDAWRRPEEYPAFGAPVHAMVSGVVVTADDRQRDHRARSGWLSVIYLLVVEALAREIGGPRFIIGNRVVIRDDNGVFALVAHLKQGSARVKVGDRVQAGQLIGLCGNSGNSSEPHVHAHLMDRANPLTAQGIPMAFAAVEVGDAAAADTLPGTGERMVAAVR